jgi:hypothetical protein
VWVVRMSDSGEAAWWGDSGDEDDGGVGDVIQ